MNRHKVGRNKLSNRFRIFNNRLTIEMLNERTAQFKIKMKQTFLITQNQHLDKNKLGKQKVKLINHEYLI